jgi:hypothetical protein
MYEIWEGDLFLFNCFDDDEADILSEQGFTVKEIK